MANTRTVTLSVRMKADTKRRLARLAKAQGRSSNYLVAEALDGYVADQERLQAELAQAERQIDSGHYIPHAAVKAWLLSWGTDDELPPPRCVCGQMHDGDALCR